MSLHVEQHGRGPVPLVMLHGWAMHGGVLAPLVQALHDHCTMHVIDLPGHGYSRGSSIPLQPYACAIAIAAITPPAIWLGWSMGGAIALTAAREMPHRVLGLAMLCATPRFVRDASWPHGADDALVHQLAVDLEADYHATLERFLALETIGSADPRGELRQLRTLLFARGEPELRVLQEGIRLLETSDQRVALAGLAMPSAWIAGRRDRLVPPKAMQWSAGQCGGSFDEIQHAGHAPFFGYADAVVEAMQPLMASTRARATP